MTRSKTVSLVIVDTDAHFLARRAIEWSIARFPVDDVLIFSDDESKWDGYAIKKIARISSYTEYNQLILAELANHLHTDFALVIQFDGFVINPSAFSDFFFKFDYIGAPWIAGWNKDKGPMVGNGGFSLRSKRLVELSARKYRPCIDFTQPEDATLCRFLRPMLEELDGIVFAPVEVARHFSMEFEKGVQVAPFGFHGLHYLPQVYGNDYAFLVENLPSRCLAGDSRQLRLLRRGFSHLPPAALEMLTRRSSEVVGK